ncbi:hypothetical protein DICPUDRAFT_42924 [Dictyostelium purpureum]|uniref:Transcription factor IIIC 90kDa subunit N-terminal domain-containing protein n=1 Tax=Dictyostelium purpureum TaxID=5786 RepID=F1A350_DICPU|nr:uncharacterized protein DICPUDRAFT_42924 [Dictyostelium purpureum]EGC29380.1 hypothetical protein DICPUDRAFT_42924 [Dictyostelium purpureum]|eukprot:XP_003294093.1 hypothetical protein DICPUDRAFT_42924 [Dictyostelium purpureum]
MYNDLYSTKLGQLHYSSYSNASKKLAFFLDSCISIYSFKNGLLKKETIKVSSKDYNKKEYSIGEPEAPVFPILRLPKDDTHFTLGCFSDVYLPSLGGGFQLLVAATSNSNVIVFRSPDISSTSINYTWELVLNVSDILNQTLHDYEFNKPIKENKTEFIDRNIHPRAYNHDTEIVSNLEFKKRSEWLASRALGWSNVMKCYSSNEEKIEDLEGNEKMIFLTVGTKRGLVLYRCLLPDLNSIFSESNFTFFKLIETHDWVVGLSWKPTFSIDQLDEEGAENISGIVALALGDGSVILQTINNNGEAELLETIVQKDSNPASILEWGPINESGESYLIICKGFGFYLYDFENKMLSNFIIAHRDKITGASFSDHSHFLTSSLDNNIIEFHIEPKFWSGDKITPSSVNYIKREENNSLGVLSVFSSPNRLITCYLEELVKGSKMFESKLDVSSFTIAYKIPAYSFQSFKSSFLQKFKSEESRNIWDYFIYINIYTNEEIIEFIKELIENEPDSKVLHYKFIIKLYYILKVLSNLNLRLFLLFLFY